ncbi:MAG: hypothetical protein PHI79_07095 [Sulfurovaceae bacterium]|nr:hypothetical protein [Sulfurovaceae bacterium]
MNDYSDYLKKVNEFGKKIAKIKSADCILDYDTKTEIIEDLKTKIKMAEEVLQLKTIIKVNQ